MKKSLFYLFLVLFPFHVVFATPSSLFYTNCTTQIQQKGVLSLGLNTFFTVFKKRGHGSQLPVDVGLTLGLFKWEDLAGEVGIDFLGSTDDPILFNAKIGMQEDKLFKHAPAFNVGIFNVGTRHHGNSFSRTDQNIVDFIFGKKVGNTELRLYLGFFSGSRTIGHDRRGIMGGFSYSFGKTKDSQNKEYFKWLIAADYASGKNTIGGGGFGFYYYFFPSVSLITGPVFFNSEKYNGSWKWLFQIYVDIPLYPDKA